MSLKDLFRSHEKHPHYKLLEARIESFRKAEKFKKNIEWRYFLNLAKSGFFCLSMDGLVLSCYDCGIELTGWKGKNQNIELDDINLIHAASLLKFKIQYLPDIFKDDIKLETENSDSALQDFVSPELFRQRFSKFYRVKPTCNALKENSFDFKKQNVRMRTFGSTDDEIIFHRFPFGVDDVATAGFVKTSKMTAACYSCFISVDWSSSETRVSPSPWALHAWKNKDLEHCSHLRYHLKEKKNRLQTFPKASFLSHEYSPTLLAEAGFYCMARNVGGYFWVRCHRKHCNAYSYFQRPNNKYNAFRKVSTLDNLYSNITTIVRGKMLLEVPGSGQNKEQLPIIHEHPLIEHFMQNPICSFITNYLESAENRVKTYPPDWQARNKLSISVEEVAAAGFIYFPESYSQFKTETEYGLSRFVKSRLIINASQLSSHTICPTCHHIVDWSAISQKYDLTSGQLMAITEISHCK